VSFKALRIPEGLWTWAITGTLLLAIRELSKK
jgi:hypothetical protein